MYDFNFLFSTLLHATLNDVQTDSQNESVKHPEEGWLSFCIMVFAFFYVRLDN